MQTEESSNKKERSSKTLRGKLPRFLRHHKKLSAIAIAFLVATFLLFLFQPLFTGAIASKRTELLQAQATTLHTVNQLPSPNRMVIGQQNADARFVSTRTSQLTDTVIDEASNLSLPSRYFVVSAFTANTSPANVRELRGAFTVTSSSIQEDLYAYSATLDALLRFIEYSPHVDLIEYDPGTSDTQERMQRLADGLSDTRETLETISNSAPQHSAYINRLIEVIDEAIAAQRTLQETHNTEAFIAAASPLQKQATSILTEYFSAVQREANERLVQLSRLIQRAL